MNRERSALALLTFANALLSPFLLNCSFADVTGRGHILSGFRYFLMGLPTLRGTKSRPQSEFVAPPLLWDAGVRSPI